MHRERAQGARAFIFNMTLSMSGWRATAQRQHEEKERKCFRAFPSGVGWLDGTRVVAGGPWRGGRRAIGLGRCSISANMGGGEMSRAVCLRLLIGRQCFDGNGTARERKRRAR